MSTEYVRSKDYDAIKSQVSDVSVLLLRPPIFFSAKSYSTPVAMPIGLTYIAAVLRKSQYAVRIIDAVGMGINHISLAGNPNFKYRGIPEEKFLDLVKQSFPNLENKKREIIGVTIMFSQEWPFIRDIIKKIREIKPHALIVAGGEHVTAMSEYCLRDCPVIDYIIRGEGELAFLEFVSNFEEGKNLNHVQGVAFLDGDQYRENSLAPRIKSLDNFPWPAWDLIDVEPYFRPNDSFGLSRTKTMALLATRGCPYQCTFCSNEQMYTTQYKMRTVEDVIAEIEFYKAEYGINSIEFYDLTAIVNSKWIIEFAEKILEKKLNIEWQLPSGTRSEALSDEVLKKIKQAGLSFITYAPESGSEFMLKSIKKRVTLEKMFASIQSAKKYGLIVKVNFIIGFPNEVRKDVYQSFWCILKLAFYGVDDCNVALFSPYPGSEIYNELRKKNVISKIDDDYFIGLMTQFDLFIAKTVCEKIPSLELMLYRTIMMSAFYGISFLVRPKKILRLLKILFTKNTQFRAESVFEQRIFDLKLKNSLEN